MDATPKQCNDLRKSADGSAAKSDELYDCAILDAVLTAVESLSESDLDKIEARIARVRASLSRSSNFSSFRFAPSGGM